MQFKYKHQENPVIEFTANVPKQIQQTLTDLHTGKIEGFSTEQQYKQILQQLENAFKYSSQIKIPQFDLHKKFSKTTISTPQKNTIHELCVKILFGNVCKKETMDKLKETVSLEFQKIKDGSTEDLTDVFGDVCRFISLLPPESRSLDLIVFIIKIYKTLHPNRRCWTSQELEKFPIEERAAIVQHVARLMKLCDKGDGVDTLLRAFKSIPSNDREALLITAQPLLDDLSDVSQIASILNGLNHIPSQERANIISKCDPLLKSLKDGDIRGELLKIVYNIPAEDRDEILCYAPIIKKYIYITSDLNLLYSIRSVNPDRRATVVHKALPLLCEGESNAGIIEIIAKIPSDECDEVLAIASPIVIDMSKGTSRAEVIEAVWKIPASERGKIISQITPFVTDIKEGAHRASLIKAYMKVSLDKRKELLEHLADIMKVFLSSAERHKLLESLSAFHSRERTDIADIIAHTKQLCEGLTDLEDQSSVCEMLKAISKIPPNDRSDLVKHAIPLMKGVKGQFIEKILEVVGNCPPNQRGDIAVQMKPLLQLSKEASFRSWSIKAVLKMPSDERSDVISKSLPLLKYVDKRCQMSVLKFMGSIPRLNRITFVRLSKRYVKNDSYSNLRVMRVLKDLIIANRLELIRCYDRLKKGESHNANVFSDILNCLINVPGEEIGELINQVLFISRGIEVEDRDGLGKILEQLIKIPYEDRDEVISRSAPLLRLLNTVHQKNAVICAVANLPFGERASVLSIAIPLCRKCKHGSIMAEIIVAISEIPIDERWNFIEETKRLFLNEVPITGDLIKTFYKITSNQRKEIVQLILPMLKGENKENSNQIIWLLHAVESLPSKNRKEVLALLEPLFKKCDLNNKIELIRHITHFSEDIITISIPILTPLLLTVEHSCQRRSILETAAKIPFEELKDVLEKSLSLVKDINYKEFVILAVHEIPLEVREELIKAALPLVKGMEDGSKIASILRALKAFPSNEREEAIKGACTLCKDTKYEYTLAEILKELSKIPQSQRSDVIAHVDALLQGVSNHYYYERTDLVKAVAAIDQKERKNVLQAAAPLLKGVDGGKARAQIIVAITKIPPDEREEVIRIATTLIQQTLLKMDPIDIISTILTISNEQRENVVSYVLPLLLGIEKGEQIVELLKAIDAILPLQRQEVMSKTLELMKGCVKGNYVITIIQLLNQIPQNDRTDVILHATPLFEGVTNGNQKANIIKQVSLIPSNERNDVIHNFLVLMKNISLESSSHKILQALHKIPIQFRPLVVEKAKPLMGKYSDFNVPTTILPAVYKLLLSKEENCIEQCTPLLKEVEIFKEKAEVLSEFAKVPLEDRDRLISICIPLFSNGGWDRVELLRSIARLPPENWDNIIYLASTLLKDSLSGKTWAKIIDTIFQIPAEQREDVVKRTAALKLKDEYSKGQHGEYLLKSIADIPSGERDQILELVRPLIKGIDRNFIRSEIINTIASMHPSERKNVISKSAHWLAGLDTVLNNKLISPVLEAVHHFPRDQRGTIHRTLGYFLQGVRDSEFRAKILIAFSYLPPGSRETIVKQSQSLLPFLTDQQKHLLLEVFGMVAPHKLKEAIKTYADNPKLLENDIVLNLFSASAEVRYASHEYLLKALEDAVPYPQKLRKLAKNIVDLSHSLLVQEDHPLFQKAIEMLAVVDPDAMHNKKNPYKLHNSLKKIIETEPLVDLSSSVVPINGKDVGICIETFRKRAIKREFTYKDLPANVPRDGFKILYERLENRINDLSQREKSAVEKYITDSFINSLDVLKTQFLGKPVIISLLMASGKPDQLMEPTVFYLFSILDAVLKADSKLGERMLLSPQEELLLRVSCSINECPTGIRDGITNYYNKLPLEFRAGREEELRGPEAKVAHLADMSMQRLLGEVFASQELVKDISRSETISLMPHQTLYLKNRLHKQIGLNHRLILDFYSGTISDGLVDANLSLMMEAFFKQCTIEKMIAYLQKDVAETLQGKRIGYMDLLYTIEPTILRIMKYAKLGPEKYSDYFVLDDDCKPLGVTVEGALLVLLTLEYLKLADEKEKTIKLA